jgi:hypothetical protein
MREPEPEPAVRASIAALVVAQSAALVVARPAVVGAAVALPAEQGLAAARTSAVVEPNTPAWAGRGALHIWVQAAARAPRVG